MRRNSLDIKMGPCRIARSGSGPKRDRLSLEGPRRHWSIRGGVAFSLSVLLLVSPAGAAFALEDDSAASHPRGERTELRERAERRLRTYRAVALAERLELDEAQALAMNAVISRYDEKRRELRAEVAAHMQVLERAAREDEPAEDEVAAAIESVLTARAHLEELRRSEAEELLSGLDPSQQARLMLFFREFPREVQRLMREGRKRGRDRRGEPGFSPKGPSRPAPPDEPSPRPPPLPPRHKSR